METISEIFSRHGYVGCIDDTPESGYEKIALYWDPRIMVITHAARQLPDGHWASKLGPDEDIEHNDLQALEGDPLKFPLCYGTAIRFMKRPTN